MAALTKAAKDTPFHLLHSADSFDRGRLTVNCMELSGAGTDATEIAAAAAVYQHVILGGYVETDGGAAEDLVFLSAAGAIATVSLAAAAGVYSLHAYRGSMTDSGEALNANKSGAVAVVFARVFYVSVPAAETINFIGTAIE